MRFIVNNNLVHLYFLSSHFITFDKLLIKIIQLQYNRFSNEFF